MSLGTPYNVRKERCEEGYSTDLPVMLNPDLQNLKQPAAKLSTFFKDLMWYAEDDDSTAANVSRNNSIN